MVTGQDPTRDPWFFSQMCISSQTSYRLRYPARSVVIWPAGFLLPIHFLMHCMLTNHLNPNNAEYHIYIQIAKLCEMSALANFALHVDVTHPGDHGSQYATISMPQAV